MKKITSRQNSFIKYLSSLQKKSSLRKKEGKFIIEGKREILLAHKKGYDIESILYNPEIINYEQIQELLGSRKYEGEVIEISQEVYEKLAYRDSTEGIIALARSRNHDLNSIKLTTNPLILIAENIEKPGNIGAMIRTADAAGIDAFILANPITDIYNPNIIRSSLGGVFTVQIGMGITNEVLAWLKKQNIRLFSATLQDSVPYYEINMTLPTAIAVGSEAQGLSQPFRQQAEKNILIPMRGELDSLNVSVSAAILVFEAVRQRYK